jgi:Pyruvate/2-oxoacid:ferredoxin oxidoreductase gamma subunit
VGVATEREVLLTGIGGQGVQLAARTLALAAVRDGREVMVFGVYGGSMRGGNTDATVVIGDGPLWTPPTVDEAWSAIAMHHEYWPDVRDRLRPGGVAVIDTSIFRGELGLDDCAVVTLEATTMASDLGNPLGGSMVALGAFAAASTLVTAGALLAAAAEVLPSYRASHAEANARCLRAGFEHIAKPVVEAWPATEEVRAR